MKYVALVVLIVLNCLLLAGSFVAHEEQVFIDYSVGTFTATADNGLTFESVDMRWLEMREAEIIYFDGNKYYKLVLMEGGK